MLDDHSVYHPARWERITAAAVAVFIVALISFLIVRDTTQPGPDPNSIVFARILLSLACAILGAVIPGFLGVDLQVKGWQIRAGGAAALFVITFFFTPDVWVPPPQSVSKKIIVEGSVLDKQQNPIAGAKVTFLGGVGGGSISTGSDGRFSKKLSFQESGGTATLNIYHEKYYSYKITISITSKDIKIGDVKKVDNIVMEKRDHIK